MRLSKIVTSECFNRGYSRNSAWIPAKSMGMTDASENWRAGKMYSILILYGRV
jgi:hypothetical protein